MKDAERKARAARRRRSAVLVRTTLEAETLDVNPIRGADALSLVWPLTRESWSLGRRETPRYDRASTPYRFVRGRLT